MARKSAKSHDESAFETQLGSTVKVHPKADIFPMLEDDQLISLAESIAKNGQRHPITFWENGDGRILIDGRNRFKACEFIGVEPQYSEFKGTEDDVLAYIADVNLERRDLKEDQKIMALAKIYQKPTQGKKLDPELRKKFSKLAKTQKSAEVRLGHARQVLEYKDLADSVLAGTKPLYKAYEEAKQRKFDSESEEAKLEELRREAPDLADLVPGLPLSEALGAWEKRKEETAARLESAIRGSSNAIIEASRSIYSLGLPSHQEGTLELINNVDFIERTYKALMWEFVKEDTFHHGLDFLIEVIAKVKKAKEEGIPEEEEPVAEAEEPVAEQGMVADG
jgi:ParB-like chromosome segregation protein Spo0J